MTDPARPDPASVPVQPAATVMLVRDRSANEPGVPEPGIEVFMLRRTASAAFGAGMFVFPGGRVDPADGGDEVAEHCTGLDDVEASRRLGIDSGGLSYWVASVRECFEEAGVLLARRLDGRPLELRASDRHAVHDAAITIVELCSRDGLVIDLSATHYVDHWITPVGERRRFDTRFVLARAPSDQVHEHDNRETVESLWVEPADALAMVDSGELVMMPPTIVNLRRLVGHSSVSSALDWAATVDQPPCVEPRLRRGPDGSVIGVAMPDDADYHDL